MLTFVQYLDEEIIRFSDYNLNQKFHHFNQLIFGGKLPHPTLTWDTRMKGASGQTTWTHNSSTGVMNPGTLKVAISAMYKTTEERLDAILVHEMIHVYFATINDPWESHGTKFKVMCQHAEQHVGFKIPLTDDTSELEFSDEINPVKIGAILINKPDGTSSIALFNQATLEQSLHFLGRYYRLGIAQNKPGFRGFQFVFLTGKSKLGKKYKVQRSTKEFNTYRLSPENKKELLQSCKEIYRVDDEEVESTMDRSFRRSA